MDKWREQVITFCGGGVVGMGWCRTESCNFIKKSCNFSMGKKGDIGEGKGLGVNGKGCESITFPIHTP